MKFHTVPVAEAEGAILAHSVQLADVSFKKGRTLSRDDTAALIAGGRYEVMVARLEPGDVPEDIAAGRIARALAGAATTTGEAFTGRANLYAARAGLATISPETVIELNSIDEGLTLATVPPFERVAARQMLATVKVIPFALPEAVVAAAEKLAATARAKIAVAPFKAATAGLILTRVTGTKPSVLEKRRQSVETRLAAAGSRLGPVETCEHDTAALAKAIAAMRGTGADPILVFGASAIVDRGDVVPAALASAGGEVIHVGMPVDPGNLLMLGRIGTADVIGVPSCAASPKINGFDWVLQRRLAGLPVGRAEIVAMAPGGLLKEIATRPQPREGGGMAGDRSEPRIAAVVLAAGRSTRMGPRNKLTEEVGGVPMLRRVVEAALASRARPVVVVTGHQQTEVAASLAGLDVTFAHNPRYADGLSASLIAGVTALPKTVDAAIIALGDMPGVAAPHFDKLMAAFSPEDGRAICIATHGGKRGNPVLLAASLFQDLLKLTGDSGARQILGQHADLVVEVEMGSDAVLLDVDTPEALEGIRRGQ
jgi:molybdenum cofactor cytidylyltransferase